MDKVNIIIVLILINTLQTEIQADCISGWFGSKCQYMCHCSTGTSCDVNGQCPSLCASGWFGLGCQYQDFATIPGADVTTLPIQTITWLTDGSDTTCNADQNIQYVKILWNTAYPFTWLRFKLKDSSALKSFVVTFKTMSNVILSCSGLEIFDLDATTLDYRCDLNETIQELKVTGAGLKFLCSLYVSGGRNVALNQSSTQSSTYDKGSSMLAVDGRTSGIYLDGTCSHTVETDPSPSWTLALDTPKVVNRFVLYNRDPKDCCSDRLRYFKLETLDTNNKIMWTYQDTRETLLVYTVTRIQKNTVSKIRITATNTFQDHVVLTLCEVIIFGECVPGTWGLECNLTCPGKCNMSCHQDTGACQSGCELGYWGSYCQNDCSVNCHNRSCDKMTGACDIGCNGFSNPPNCTLECSQGSWGYNCKNVCSSNCYNGNCDKFTGICDEGCNGFNNPPICSAECSTGKWGPNCKFSCRNNCFNNSCDKITGICNNGCNGYMDPPDCIVECKTFKWGRNCLNNCGSKCLQQRCDRVSGLCNLTCDGRTNTSCPSDCPNGFYGDNCTLECSSTCKDLICGDHGYCISCKQNYQGHFCEKSVTMSLKECDDSDMNFQSGIGIGIAVGFVAVVIIDIVLVIIFRTRRARKQQNSESRQGTQLQPYDGVKIINEYNHSYETTGTSSKIALNLHEKKSPYENNSSSVYESISEQNQNS